MQPIGRSAMPVALSGLEKRYKELNASVAAKALSQVAADDEGTQILKAADGLELGGDGKARRRHLIKRTDALLDTTASQGHESADQSTNINQSMVNNRRTWNSRLASRGRNVIMPCN